MANTKTKRINQWVQNDAKGRKMTRSETLDLAKGLISGQRQKDYGPASEMFESIAIGWNVIIKKAGGQVSPAHVALMMDWLKTCRLSETIDHKDSWIDKCGYSALGSEIAIKDE